MRRNQRRISAGPGGKLFSLRLMFAARCPDQSRHNLNIITLSKLRKDLRH